MGVRIKVKVPERFLDFLIRVVRDEKINVGTVVEFKGSKEKRTLELGMCTYT